MDGENDVSLLYPNQLIGKVCAKNRYKTYHHNMVEASIHLRLDYIYLIYIYKVITYSGAMDGHMDVSLLYPNQGGYVIGYVWATNRYKPYHHD